MSGFIPPQASPLSWGFRARLLNQLRLALPSPMAVPKKKPSEELGSHCTGPWDRLAQLSALHPPSPQMLGGVADGFLGETDAPKTAGLSVRFPSLGPAIRPPEAPF